MSTFAVHAILSVTNGVTDEASQEADTLDDALGLIRELAESVPSFLAVTLVHVEDHSRLVQGALAREVPA